MRTELITVADFLDINFGDNKVELDHGVIRMKRGIALPFTRVGEPARVSALKASWLRMSPARLRVGRSLD